MSISRREFVGMTGLAAATALSGDMEGAGIGPVKTYRAAVIGRTGRGNYGHGLDLAFQKIPNVTVVAVADEDAPGRLRTVQRTGALRAYADWREMLSKEKPDLVTIGPRWVEDRLEMVTAAAQAGSPHIHGETDGSLAGGGRRHPDGSLEARHSNRPGPPGPGCTRDRLPEREIGGRPDWRTPGDAYPRQGGPSRAEGKT